MLPAHYDYRLVTLSVFVAICAAYAAVDLAERITTTRRSWKVFWISGGACAMGAAIWSMHYIGMLAFELPVPVRYDLPLVLISLVIAIAASGTALIFVSQAHLSRTAFAVGALVMGSGIAAMHYIGMAAMRMTCICTYDWRILTLSIVIAVVVSSVAIFALRSPSALGGSRKVPAGVFLGLAICSMHYTGMAAAHFWQSDRSLNFSGTANISWIGGIAIASGALLLLAIVMLTSHAEKRFTAQSHRLSSTQERYRALFERSLAGIYIASLDGTMIDLNDACAKLLGYGSRKDVIGKAVRAVHMTPENAKSYLELLSTTKQFPAREIRLFRADGSMVWVLMSATLLEFQDGSPPEIQGMLLDIDELKRTEDQLRLAKFSAESANLAKTQFLANMSHELRTPLNGVLGMTQLLTETGLSQEQKDYVEIARNSAESLLALINHIFEFSTSEAGQIATSGEEFDIRKVLREEIGWAAPLAHDKHLRLRAEVSPEVAEKFWGEPRWIRQILAALLSNALRFTHEGEIVVTISAKGHAGAYQLIRLSVSDTGVGIPPEKISVIFEPFTQVDDSNTRTFGGAGLGLSIVQNLAKAMGGQVAVDSQPGRGSMFTVLLPLLTEPEPTPSSTSASPSAFSVQPLVAA